MRKIIALALAAVFAATAMNLTSCGGNDKDGMGDGTVTVTATKAPEKTNAAEKTDKADKNDKTEMSDMQGGTDRATAAGTTDILGGATAAR